MLALLLAGLAGCTAPPPALPNALPAAVSPAGASSAPLIATPSASLVAGVPLDVRMAGKIGCAQFPYGCFARLSVLAPTAMVADAWRPPDTDPEWAPDFTDSVYSTDHLQPGPVGSPPVLAPGRHLVVVSLLGSYDARSLKPDGSLVTDLLARCSATVEVGARSGPLTAVVTFEPEESSFGGTCLIKIKQP